MKKKYLKYLIISVTAFVILTTIVGMISSKSMLSKNKSTFTNTSSSVANSVLSKSARASSQNSNNSSQLYSKSGEPLYQIIKSDDSEEIKQKKEKYNELVKDGEKLNEEVNTKMLNGTFTSQDDQYYKEQGQKIYNQKQALGLNPPEESADHKYQKEVDGYISDETMIMDEYKDNNGNVISQYKDKYNVAKRRKEYLEQVKKEYLAGKVSAEDALKSFDDQFTVIK